MQDRQDPHGGIQSAAASDVCFTSATELAAMLRDCKISSREVMTAHLARIDHLNPSINAIVGRLPDAECLALAAAADARAAKGDSLPPLHGLPIAFKDLHPAAGLPFTRGSPLYEDCIADADSIVVERLRAAGVIPIGKTNVPEFGMGSHTYNTVYGTTLNPYDTTKSAGGSSGGAGAALACGMLPIADGSDFGGSLRNPGNFNNVVGMRPSVGLVPTAPNAFPVLGFNVFGPLARTVQDVALLLSVMAGSDPRDPGCYPSDGACFGAALDRDVRGTRVAWCLDLDGLPLDPRVRAVLETQRATLESLGCIVEDACPDLRDADSIFLTIRGFVVAETYRQLVAQHRDLFKPEIIWNVETGLALTAGDVAHAMVQHGQLMERVRVFQETYPIIACAVNQVPPFDAALEWPKAIAGVEMTNYLEWMQSAYWISATWCPAISVPAGFTTDGLPVGLQFVGRYRRDFELLQFAHAFEQGTGFGRVRPGEQMP